MGQGVDPTGMVACDVVLSQAEESVSPAPASESEFAFFPCKGPVVALPLAALIGGAESAPILLPDFQQMEAEKMTAEAVALIERYYEAFNRDDTEAMIACLTDDIRHDVNEGGARIGKDKFREFSAHMTRCYRERLTDIVVMSEPTGTRASAEFVVNGEYLATDEGLPDADGQTYKLPAGGFFDIRDGKIARVTTYYNLAEWVRQVSGG